MQKILFVCTGNYYRSRFAEEYFNHLAEKHQLNWIAASKGLSQNMPSLNNPGAISVHTLNALDELNIQGQEVTRYPRPMTKADFNGYDKIIAMSEIEHRPMMESRFLAYCGMVDYFEVGDLPLEEPKSALSKIKQLVDRLVTEISISEDQKLEASAC